MSFAVVYPSLFNTKPARSIDSWEELVSTLKDHMPSKSKKAQALWSPVELRKNDARNNDSVKQINALVIDVDGDAEYEEAKEALLGREWVAYSTFSHTQEKQHFHMVVRLEKPIKADRWHEKYSQLKEEFGGIGDMLSAPCHAYFLPQHQPGTAYFAESSES